MEKEDKGAGLPVDRGEKRKEKADERKKEKGEIRELNMPEMTARVVELSENPREPSRCRCKGVRTGDEGEILEEVFRATKAELLKERAFKTEGLKLQHKLFTDSDMNDDAQKVWRELLALVQSTPPKPAALATVPRPESRVATKAGTSAASAGQERGSIDLATSDDRGRAETGGQGAA